MYNLKNTYYNVTSKIWGESHYKWGILIFFVKRYWIFPNKFDFVLGIRVFYCIGFFGKSHASSVEVMVWFPHLTVQIVSYLNTNNSPQLLLVEVTAFIGKKNHPLSSISLSFLPSFSSKALLNCTLAAYGSPVVCLQETVRSDSWNATGKLIVLFLRLPKRKEFFSWE